MSSKCLQVPFSLTWQENAAWTKVLSDLAVTPAPAVLRARGGTSQGDEEHIFLWEIHSTSKHCPVDGSQRYGAEARVGEGNKGKSSRKNGFNL